MQRVLALQPYDPACVYVRSLQTELLREALRLAELQFAEYQSAVARGGVSQDTFRSYEAQAAAAAAESRRQLLLVRSSAPRQQGSTTHNHVGAGVAAGAWHKAVASTNRRAGGGLAAPATQSGVVAGSNGNGWQAELVSSRLMALHHVGSPPGSCPYTRYVVVRLAHTHRGGCCCASTVDATVYDVRTRTTSVSRFHPCDLASLGAPVRCGSCDASPSDTGRTTMQRDGEWCGVARLLPWLVTHLELHPGLQRHHFASPARVPGASGVVPALLDRGRPPARVAVLASSTLGRYKPLMGHGLNTVILLRCGRRIRVASEPGRSVSCVVTVRWCDTVAWPSPWLVVWASHLEVPWSGTTCPVRVASVQSLRHLMLRSLTFKQRQSVARRVADSLALVPCSIKGVADAGSVASGGPLCGMSLQLNCDRLLQGGLSLANTTYDVDDSEAWVRGVATSLSTGTLCVVCALLCCACALALGGQPLLLMLLCHPTGDTHLASAMSCHIVQACPHACSWSIQRLRKDLVSVDVTHGVGAGGSGKPGPDPVREYIAMVRLSLRAHCSPVRGMGLILRGGACYHHRSVPAMSLIRVPLIGGGNRRELAFVK